MTGMQMAHFISPVLDETACNLWLAAYHVAQVPSFQASILLPPSVVVPPLPIAGAGGSQKAQPLLDRSSGLLWRGCAGNSIVDEEPSQF
jgi:hypothetical protein